ncbi:serine/threonine protein kinase [Enhygromyxa salina]|uniref:Serine/threonine protein kinase n=1 Tax=Enhygromyxa salina TaxID=215803 RepID=A0A0C2CXW5_9BACT|nr:serine/threonine protein kinase [Enhygromyxa salina]
MDERYRIDALLGAGGMGTVYKATSLASGESVALKTMLPRLAVKTAARARFQREAQAILRMDHDNFVKVLDYGEMPPHTPYLVMEFLEGAVLRDVMESDDPLTSLRAVEIVQGVLKGLAHAHARGVVHRDIKPENVFMVAQADGPGLPKLLDLGLAKFVSTDDSSTPYKLTMRGAVFGTPAYMAPEQALGEEVDGRADLYATTVMLFELLTGRRPFYARDSPALLVMHTRREPPKLVDYAPFLVAYPRLQEVVSRGLAKLPMMRFPSADAYLEALEEVVLEIAGSNANMRSAPRHHTATATAMARADAGGPSTPQPSHADEETQTLTGIRAKPSASVPPGDRPLATSLRSPVIVVVLLAVLIALMVAGLLLAT